MNIAELCRLYPMKSNAEIARILGTSKNNVAITAWRLGLKKDVSYLSSVNRVNGAKGLKALYG